MNNEFIIKIKSFLDKDQATSKKKLLNYIQKEFPELKKSSINVYLSQLKKDGIIKNPSRGSYKLRSKEQYCPNIDLKLTRIFNKVMKKFPYAEVCIWNTKWLNEFMRHQPFKFYIVIEVEKDVAEYMKQSNLEISIEFNKGNKSFTCYTMDFTQKYISINSDYRS